MIDPTAAEPQNPLRVHRSRQARKARNCPDRLPRVETSDASIIDRPLAGHDVSVLLSAQETRAHTVPFTPVTKTCWAFLVLTDLLAPGGSLMKNDERPLLQLRLGRGGINDAEPSLITWRAWYSRLTMTEMDSAGLWISKHAPFYTRMPIRILQKDTEQNAVHNRVPYMLGFGLGGAILTNALVFGYFAWLYASG